MHSHSKGLLPLTTLVAVGYSFQLFYIYPATNLPAGRNSNSTRVKPSFTLTSGLNWSQSRFSMGQSSMDLLRIGSLPMGFGAGSLIPDGDNNSAQLCLVADKSHFGFVDQLLGKGASLNVRNQGGNTLLPVQQEVVTLIR